MDLSGYFDDFTRRDWERTLTGRVRIAVVGLGRFAINRALPAIHASEGCQPTVLVSGSPAKAQRVADEFGITTVIDYGAMQQGDAVDEYDAVYVATPPAFHRPYTEAAARLGKHVLCEKPLARSVEEAEAMVTACDEGGVTLMTAYRLRTEPAVRRMREMVHDGVIGQPIQIGGGFSTRLLDTVGRDSWRLNPDIAGGGALLDLGIYPLNVARFLLDMEPSSICAATTSRAAPFDRVDEHVSFQLRFPDGTTASCTASLNAHPDNRLRVLGSEGQILMREPFGGHTSQQLLVESAETQTHHVGPPVDEVREEFDYFATCILTEMHCETDGEDGLMDLRIVEAGYESADIGTAMSL